MLFVGLWKLKRKSDKYRAYHTVQNQLYLTLTNGFAKQVAPFNVKLLPVPMQSNGRKHGKPNVGCHCEAIRQLRRSFF